MSTAVTPRAVIDPPKPRRTLGNSAVTLVMLALLGLSIWSVMEVGISISAIVDSFDNATRFVSRMFPLDFPDAGHLLSLTFETLAIVFLATMLGVALSIPIALAAAQATTRGRISRSTARVVIVLARAIPDLVLAIIFLRIFGLGPAAGVLAMGLHSVGMIGKLYADAIEELNDGPRTSIAAVGGTRGQQIWSSITQPLLPQMIATALHRFDINLRTSVLLGYVGVGGLGLAISESLRVLNYQRGMALAFVVLLLCIFVELLSGSIRAAIMSASGGKMKGGTWVDKMLASQQPAELKEPRFTPPWTFERITRFVSYGTVIVLLIASLIKVDISPATLWNGLANIPRTVGLFLPPSDRGIAASIYQQMLVTVQIALAATLLGAILAIPIGILAARNVMPKKWVHTTFRVIIVIIRGVPELILAIIFVVITGLGGVAGTLALALGAVGLLSKLVADSLEETDTRVQEAVRATGASELQVFFSATLRQAAPAFVAHIMYLLDVNIRSATLLGVVGAGGIGFLLMNATRVNQFDVVTYILIVTLVVVLAVEALSMWMRRAVR